MPEIFPANQLSRKEYGSPSEYHLKHDSHQLAHTPQPQLHHRYKEHNRSLKIKERDPVSGLLVDEDGIIFRCDSGELSEIGAKLPVV
ncbi:hypothetical protein N9184_01030, partial [bacterium]|nr:hypothetical protein [bacterium]